MCQADGVNNVGIGATATNIAAHRLPDFVGGSCGAAIRLFQQRGRRHDLAGCAIAALEGIAFDERGLDGMQGIAGSQTLDGCDLFVLMHDGERQAGIDPHAVHMNRARTALSVITSLFGTRQMKVLPKSIEKRDPGFDRQLMALAVDLQSDFRVRVHLFSVNRLGRFLNAVFGADLVVAEAAFCPTPSQGNSEPNLLG